MTIKEKLNNLENEYGDYDKFDIEFLKKVFKHEKKLSEYFKKKFPRSPFDLVILFSMKTGKAKSRLLVSFDNDYTIEPVSKVVYLDKKVVNRICK